MASEVQFQTISGVATCYFVIRNAAGLVYNGTTFVSFVDSNISTYANATTEQGTGSGYFVGDFPAITLAGTYSVIAYHQAGGSPNISDTPVAQSSAVWNGTTLTPPPIPSSQFGTATGYLYTRTSTGLPVSGVKISYRLIAPPPDTDGTWDLSVKSSTSDSNGLVTLVLAVEGTYQYWAGSGQPKTITVPVDEYGSSFELPLVRAE